MKEGQHVRKRRRQLSNIENSLLKKRSELKESMQTQSRVKKLKEEDQLELVTKFI